MVSQETVLAKRQARLNRRFPGTSIADKKRLEERRKLAMELRMAGATLQDIVNAPLGYTTLGQVSRDLKKALSNFYLEDIEALLILDLARIDEMQKICTMVMRQNRDTSQVRNIMALMNFRRETMGYTPEQIADRRTAAGAITNNGIMVVQGSTRDYLQGVMEAAGASPEVIQKELSALETETASKAGKVIQGEIVPELLPETGTRTEKIKTTTTRTTKSGKRVKLVSKTREPAQPGPHKPPEASRSAQQPARVSQVALGDSILLGELVEAQARKIQKEIERMHEPGMGDLSDPALIPKELEIPVKLRDNNVPVTSGISYKTPPRKPTQEEGRREATRRLRTPSTVDRVRVRVYEEEITE